MLGASSYLEVQGSVEEAPAGVASSRPESPQGGPRTIEGRRQVDRLTRKQLSMRYRYVCPYRKMCDG